MCVIVILCARCDHADIITRRGLDGVPRDGRWTLPVSEGGVAWRDNDASSEDMQIWVSRRGWVHFITHEGQMHCAVVDAAQTRVMRNFARAWRHEFVGTPFLAQALQTIGGPA